MARRAIKTVLIILAVVVLFAIGAAGYYFGRIVPLIKAGKEHGIYNAVASRASAAGFGFEIQSGARKKIADLKGKVVVVDVWASWCGTCIYNIPKIIALRTKYPDQSVEIVGLNLDDNGWAKVKPFLKKHPEINYTIAVPSPAPSFLIETLVDLKPLGSVSVLPTIFVIDRSGALAGKFVSSRHEQEIDDLVSKLIEE
jgi:thiol-disulfide isomerase/thioredoxin